jgi:hypothetical protein
MSTPETCRRTDRSCIESLADGWILATDLCPTCTRTFMTALDGAVGSLKWHQAYVERAGAASSSEARTSRDLG